MQENNLFGGLALSRTETHNIEKFDIKGIVKVIKNLVFAAAIYFVPSPFVLVKFIYFVELRTKGAVLCRSKSEICREVANFRNVSERQLIKKVNNSGYTISKRQFQIFDYIVSMTAEQAFCDLWEDFKAFENLNFSDCKAKKVKAS